MAKQNICQTWLLKGEKKNKEIMILSTTKPTDNGSNLIVGLLTTHVPLKNCLNYITKQVIEDKVILFHQTLRKLWKIDKPKKLQ